MAVGGAAVLDPDEQDTARLIFLPLVTTTASGDLEGRLAERWEHSSDYREWTYHVRPGLRWHDASPVTAHDVKFTLDLLNHPDVGEGHFPSNTVLDDFTVRVRDGRGFDQGIAIRPKHLLERLDPKTFYGWDFWTHPVGNGPYRFVRYLPQTMFEFEANPEYYRGKPKIERLVIKFAGNARLTELLAGNVDVVREGNPSDIPAVLADPRFRVYYSVSPDSAAIYWKHDHLLFRDPRVRRALTLAIDRRELSHVVNLPADLPFSDGVFTPRQIQRRELPAPIPYDPAEASTLLDAAGWHGRDGTGVRQQDGRPFTFTALVRSDRYNLDRLAVLVQAHLRRVGVHMDIQFFADSGVVGQRVTAGHFEAAFIFHNDAPDFQRTRFGGGNTGNAVCEPRRDPAD